MNFKHECGIYVCQCMNSGKRYIGQSKDVKLRKCSHLSDLRGNRHGNKHLQKTYAKYGEENLVWDVLEYCPREKLNERERYWIKRYDTFANGFNQTEGGVDNRVYKRTEEFKRKLAQTLKKKWDSNHIQKKKFSERMKGSNNPMYGKTGALNPSYGKDHSGNFNGMFGKHQTAEAKEKNRLAHLGINNKMSKAVVCVETNEIFASQGEAGRMKKCDSATINKVIRGVKKTAGGYHWRYATQEETKTLTHIA